MADYPVEIKYSDFIAAGDPLVEGFEEGGDDSPTSSAEGCASKKAKAASEAVSWGVESVSLASGGKKSTSFDDPNHAPVAASVTAPERFYFAPTQDQVVVSWVLKNAAQAGELTLELYRHGSGAPVWKRTLAAEAAKKQTLDAPWDGSFPEAEWVDTTSFPANLVTAAHSPYLFKVKAGGNAEAGFVERWTYFDVLVHGISLDWCPEPEKVLPIAVPDPDDGVRARHLKTNEALRDPAAADNLGDKFPAEGENKKVYLKSNIFYQGESELRGANNEYFTKYKNLWGDGAMIPLLVSAKVRNAADKAVDAPAALGKVKYLWDWEDKATADTPGIQAGIKAFVGRLMDYKSAATDESPAGKNCHVERGGKRGPGAMPVFPAQAGTAPVEELPDPGDDAADFPFKVELCATRKWSAISESWTEGVFAGSSGVIFQPSRMAGDAYALHVSLFFDTEDDAVAAAAAPAPYPKPLHASSGTFTVWNEIDIAKYVQIGVGAAAVDMNTVKTDLAKFFVKLNYDPANLVDGTAQWQAGMQEIYPAAGRLRPRLAPYIQDALPAAATGDTLIEFKAFGDFKTAWVARHGGADAAYTQSLAIANPTNAIGEQKYDWYARAQLGVQTYPFQRPWPVDHANEVTLASQGKVKVVFDDPKGGTREHTIVFEDSKRIIKKKNIDLSFADKFQLATHYLACIQDANGQNPPYRPGTDQPIRVTLHGKTDANNQPRLANIRAALDRIVEMAWNNEDGRGSYPKSDDAVEPNGEGMNPAKYQNTCKYEWVWNIIELVLYDQFPAVEGGIYLFQIGNVETCNFYGPKAKAMFADRVGDKIICVLSKAAKWPTLEHEIGHCKFINHTYATDAGNDPLELHQQDAVDACTMVKTGVGTGNTFCGLCMLRMRGWSIFKVTTPATGAFDLTQRMLKKDGT